MRIDVTEMTALPPLIISLIKVLLMSVGFVNIIVWRLLFLVSGHNET